MVSANDRYTCFTYSHAARSWPRHVKWPYLLIALLVQVRLDVLIKLQWKIVHGSIFLALAYYLTLSLSLNLLPVAPVQSRTYNFTRCRCQNRRISGRGSRTVRLRLMVTRGGGHNVTQVRALSTEVIPYFLLEYEY